MKKLLLLCSLFVGTSALVSCSSDDDASATSITLSSDSETIVLGSSVTLNVTNNLDQNVTEDSAFYEDGSVLESNVFTPVESGTYTFYAVNDDLTSNTLTVTVEAPSNSFVIDGVPGYDTSLGGFYLAGLYEGGLTQFYFMAFEEVDNGDGTYSYPNDLGIGILFQAAEPSGYDPETEESYYTIADVTPPTGSYPWISGWDESTLPAGIGAYVVAGDDELVGNDQTVIESVDFNLVTIAWPTTAEDEGVLEANYKITLTNGMVLEGAYNGPANFWQSSGGRFSVSLGDVTPSVLNRDLK